MSKTVSESQPGPVYPYFVEWAVLAHIPDSKQFKDFTEREEQTVWTAEEADALYRRLRNLTGLPGEVLAEAREFRARLAEALVAYLGADHA